MKMIKLLSSAYVNGSLRHPHEGVLALEDAEGVRLVDNGAGEDVTSDFTAKQLKDVVPEPLATVDALPATPELEPVAHQATVTPDIAEGDAVAPAPKE